MDKKSLTYSAVLLIGLVFVSILLNQGIIQGVHSNSHVKLTTDQSVYPQGGEIVFTGEIEFALNEQVDIKEVRLKNLTGPVPLDVGLPVEPTGTPFVTFVNIPVASGTLVVNVAFPGITGGSSTGTTIPGTTLPGGSDGLKGTTAASKIIYTVKWTPPDNSAAIGSYAAKLSVELKDSTKLESSVASYSIVAGTVVSISGPSDVNEASGTATFIVKVSPTPTESIVVNYKTVDGTAVAGQDYVGIATTTAALTTGQATTSISVTILEDTINESTEEFSVQLVSIVVGTVTLDPRPAKATIIDNDADPTVTLTSTSTSIIEGNTGTSTISIPVSLSTSTGRTVTVSYATQDGTATVANNDYQSASGTVTFAPGVTSQQINVVVNGDTAVEANETFKVNLSNAFATKNATETIAIINATTIVTITTDDAAEVLTTRLQAALGTGKVAVVEVYVDNIKNPTTGSTSTAIAGGVKSFSGKVTFSSSSIEILGVQDANGFAGTAFATSTGQATFNANASSQTSTTSPILVAKLIVRLTGSTLASTTLTLDNLSIVASSTGATIAQDPSSKATDTYLRGDAKVDGEVKGSDAVRIAFCVVELLTPGIGSSNCHPINSASAKTDGPSGDKIQGSDAVRIRLFVVELLDSFFNPK